ncbi:MAG TPA: hypothetical protein VIJ93_13215 [bacterium]
MELKPSNSEQADAFSQMSRKIYDEYRNLKFAGIAVDPSHFLAFRKQTNNDHFTELVVSDAGVFFMDLSRKIKFKFDRACFFVYHDGLHSTEEEKIRNTDSPIIVLDNLLEFWKRPGMGFCLVADHLNGCHYLLPEQKAELDRVQHIYSKDEFIINQMLHKKKRESVNAHLKKTAHVDLDSL